jgi:hypothetical protein
MQAAVPHLCHTVAECTQPYGAPAPGAAVKDLQVRLCVAAPSLGACVSYVHAALVHRAHSCNTCT